DGIDAVYFVAQENYPIEFTELGYPVRFINYGMVCDSGGPGQYRGGAGILREYEVLADEAMLAIRIDGVVNPPWGIHGGKSGRVGRIVVNPGTAQERELKPLSDGNMLKRGDVVRIETGGGGGYGHPFDRDPEAVLEDVRAGLVSLVAAASEYGVAIARGAVDAGATAVLRANRPAAKAFHRGEYRDAL
ncbi:MAG: hydantoinase B/oxoprolinase family protein, partial [Gemmobacter sp.]